MRNLITAIILLGSLAACSQTVSTPDTKPPTGEYLTKTIQPSSSVSTPFPTQKTIAERIDTATPPPTQTFPPSPTNTLIPTALPTSTSTPQPPLVSHTWKLDQVLIEVEEGGGDCPCWSIDPPKLVLYGDGLLIRSQQSDGRDEMMARKLNRGEMCALFNTLDQVGFLDYDPSVYQDPMAGAPSTFITVNLWKKQHINGEVLGKWIYEGGDWWRKDCASEGCSPPPVILPALSNAYKLLDQYDPGGLEKLSPKQMVLWAWPEEWNNEPKPWPVQGISLKEIAQQAVEKNSYTLFFKDPGIIRELEANYPSGYYIEGDLKRLVFVRPLWPAETHFGIYFATLPAPRPVIPAGTTLTCNPADGVLPVPESR